MKTLALILIALAPVSHSSPQTARNISVTAHAKGCEIKMRGEKHGSFLELRIIKDTCKPHKLRVRAAGVCIITGFKAGNWVDRNRQKTSVSCSAAQVFSNFGYDRQLNWPHGKVKFVSLDG